MIFRAYFAIPSTFTTTAPVKPFCRVSVRVTLPVPPCATVTVELASAISIAPLGPTKSDSPAQPASASATSR